MGLLQTIARGVARALVEVNESAVDPSGLTQIVDRAEWRPVGYMTDPGVGGMVMNRPTDRADGKDEPYIRTEQDLQVIRGFARFVTTLTCPGVGIVENLQNYIIGTGLTVSVNVKRNKQAPAGLVECLKDVVDRFNEQNKISGDLDREMEGESRINGEWFLSVTPKRGPDRRSGCAVIRSAEPACVGDPGRNLWTPEEYWRLYGVYCPWPTLTRWGVHCDENDVQNVHGYFVQWNSDGMFDYMPTKFMHHLKRNRTRNVARGLSDFYPAWRWLKQQERLLMNTGEGAAELAAISYIIQYAEASKGQIEGMRAEGNGTQPYGRPVQSATGSVYVQPSYKIRRTPGTVLEVGKGQEYLTGPMGAERGQAFLEVVQGILRQVGTRWCMPEGMISGDYSNANLASSVEAGSQFHKFATAAQAKSASAWVEIFWMGVQVAYDAGLFDRFGLTMEEIKATVVIVVTFPSVEVRKPLEQAQTNQIEFEKGVLSAKTWAEESGRDYEQEVANGAKQMQPAGPFGGGMAGGDPMGGGDQGGAGGEYSDMSRLQFKRNVSSIQDVLQRVNRGEMSAGMAKQMLITLGLAPDRVEAILADIADDGTLSPANAASIAEDLAVYAMPYSRLVLEEAARDLPRIRSGVGE